MDKQITKLWDYLVDNQLTTEDTLITITNINGYNLDTLEDVLYSVTGYRSLDQIQGE